MFAVLIYKSRSTNKISDIDLSQLVKAATIKNANQSISGVLLFDGEYFLQYLEGPDKSVELLYDSILLDQRHHNVVKLMSDHSPIRRFEAWSMYLIDVKTIQHENISELLSKGSSFQSLDNRFPSQDRVLKIITAFVASNWNDDDLAIESSRWKFHNELSKFANVSNINNSLPYQFAFQPIINPLTREVSSLEALIRSPSGGSPASCFENLKPEELYLFDLESKRCAFELASQMNLAECKLSVNLSPMSLVRIPDAVNRLLSYIVKSGFAPQQVIVEITEEESISNFADFQTAIKELRLAGISVAIDDFGAGFAGLTLLSRFQPEKLKIDRSIVESVHNDGPKQAIVRAIIECANSLGITTIAEGVEAVEEWCWLQSAGVDLFQGFLFARPMLNNTPDINWPALDE